jgi:hypothetical protein
MLRIQDMLLGDMVVVVAVLAMWVLY